MEILLFKTLIWRKLRLKIFNQGIVCVLDEFSNLIFSGTSFEMKKFYFIFFFFYFYTIEYTSYRQLTRIQSKKLNLLAFTCGWNFILFSFFRHNFSTHAFKLTLCLYHPSKDLYPSYINCNPFREDVVTGIGEGIFPCACRFKRIPFLKL